MKDFADWEQELADGATAQQRLLARAKVVPWEEIVARMESIPDEDDQ